MRTKDRGAREKDCLDRKELGLSSRFAPSLFVVNTHVLEESRLLAKGVILDKERLRAKIRIAIRAA